MKTRKRWAALAVVVVCGVAVFLAWRGHPQWQAYADAAPGQPANVAGIWPDRPDAVVRSESLTGLPRDLLAVPLLKDLLTEDFLFYYDTDEDWLGLKGTLRRIAYEHQLDLGDQMVSVLLDRPADVLLWRDGKGALRHSALLLQRDLVVGIAEKLMKVALAGDRQLTKLGEFRIGETTVPVLALEVSPRRRFVMMAFGDRLAVLSSPEMARKADGALDESFIAAATRWLAPEPGARLGRFEGVALGAPAEARHSLLLSSRFLSQGYSGFFPEIAGLRFDFRQGAWNTSGLFNLPAQDPAAAFGGESWKHLPVNPAACALVPARWITLQRFLPNDGEFNRKAAQKVLQELQPAGAVCWYGDARLYEPLFLATLRGKPGESLDRDLGELFDWTINTAADKDATEADKRALNATRDGDVRTWQRAMPVADGSLNPTLLRAGNRLYFSASDVLVERLTAMHAQRYPVVADGLEATGGLVLLHVQAGQLARLLEREIRATVREGSDDAALIDRRLAPRLAAFARHGRINLLVDPATLKPGLSWQPLRWSLQPQP